MVNQRLLEAARPWIERQLGFPLPAAATGAEPRVEPGPTAPGALPLYAVRVDSVVAVSARPEWVAPLRELVRGMHPDLLFSVLGMYDLARITLPGGIAAWGPIPNYMADRHSWRSAADPRPRPMSEAELAAVDWKTFWHCDQDAVAAFGVYEDGRLAALSTVVLREGGLAELSADVAPFAVGRGLGRALIGAAGDWILDSGRAVHGSAGLWNVASSRAMRGLGMEYVFGVMLGRPGPFRVAPQPIGRPLPGAEVRDLYPEWAKSRDILPRED